MKKIVIFILILFFLVGINSLFAQEPIGRITQKEFAVRLVKEMGLNYLLPLAPNSLDCVELLDYLGVSPIGGWRPNEYLTDDTYTVIIAKAVGKESIVHEKAVYVCEHNIVIINKRWQDFFKKQSKWVELKELLRNRDYFPKGSPTCPFGIVYKDKNKDHKVDTHYHPTSFFNKLRFP